MLVINVVFVVGFCIRCGYLCVEVVDGGYSCVVVVLSFCFVVVSFCALLWYSCFLFSCGFVLRDFVLSMLFGFAVVFCFVFLCFFFFCWLYF